MNTVVEKKEKSTIDKLRDVRDKVSAETQNMTFQELMKYVEYQLNDSLFPKSVWM